jgi:hypothetical protein
LSWRHAREETEVAWHGRVALNTPFTNGSA